MGFSECDLTSKRSQTTLVAYADMLYTPQPKFAISKTYLSSKVSAEFMLSCITASVFQWQKKSWINNQQGDKQWPFLLSQKRKRGLQVACNQHAGRRLELDKLDLLPLMSKSDHDTRGGGEWGGTQKADAKHPGQLFKPNAGAWEEDMLHLQSECSAQFLHYSTRMGTCDDTHQWWLAL